ncbi:MAG TPA: hypothetical protein VGQ40_05545 [Chthoniobacterales bacterium]|nr:hypothetical protein [Chthoniobacterales bacterium]
MKLFVGAEHVRFLARDRVTEKFVGRLDLLAILLGCRFERIILLPQRRQFGLLPESHIVDRLTMKPKRRAGDNQGGDDDRGELLFKFLPHEGGDLFYSMLVVGG